jgi:hypothetical protein
LFNLAVKIICFMPNRMVYYMLFMSTAWSCTNKHSSATKAGNAVEQDCYKDRKKEAVIMKNQGTIQKIADLFMIVTQDNRYLPCEVPHAYKIEGNKVIFSGEVRAVFPHERWAGQPFQLTYISLDKP